jgi:membrane-bound serine protease (ClpP class)
MKNPPEGLSLSILELLAPFLILVLAVVLIAAEDLLPTGGILGVLAVGCLLWFLYLGFSHSTYLGVRYVIAEAVAVPLFYFSSNFMIEKTGLKRLVSLQPPEIDEIDITREGPDLGRLIGLRGRAVTTLRPSGMVDFEGRRIDGISEEGLIPSGAEVLAVQVRSGRLIVRAENLSGQLRANDFD